MRVYLQAIVGCALVALALTSTGQAATAFQRGVQHGMVLHGVRSAAATNGKAPQGVVPPRGGSGAAGPTSGRPTPGFDFPPTTGALTYHGVRVMNSSTVRTVFWDPSSLPAGASHFGANYSSLINQFVGDIAVDSPGATNVFASDTQYTDTTLGHITGNIAYGGTYTDTHAFPDTSTRTNCPAPAPCLTDTQLETELREVVIATNGWPTHTWTNSYAIMTPPGVNVCIDWASGGALGRPCSGTEFCAYHTWGDFFAPVDDPIEIYAVEPSFNYGAGCDLSPLGYPQGPNGNIADITINTLSHELNEEITDPTAICCPGQGGWFDANGEENGDKCAYNFGYRVGSTANGDYNQVVNGHPYLLQREWSNAISGCYQTGPPTISSFAPGGGAAGTSVVIHGTNFLWACSTIGNPCSAGGGAAPVVKFNGIASPSVTVDSARQLTATVPNGNATGKITVQGTITGNVTSTQNFGLQPVVSGFAPGAGFAGQIVTVNGSGFVGVTSVKINGVVGAFSAVAADGTSLHVTVPAAATTGKISVTTPGGTGTSATDFTVRPHITAFTPAAAAGGSNITISGTGFGGATVDFANSPSAAIVSQTGTSIVATVPADARNGAITVHTAGGDSTSVAMFKAMPKILGFDHATYQAGDTVIVNGSNFLGTNLDPTVKVGTNIVVPSLVTDTSFQLTIPDNAVTAPVTATNANGTTTSPTTVKVRPTITGDPAPNEAAAATHVILSGKTFQGTTSVKFNGTVTAPFTVGVGGTSLNVTVPAAAVDGPISVTNAGGTTATANPFKVDAKVNSFTPAAAAGNANVTISGTGFGVAPVVHFANAAAPAVIVSHTPTSIVAKVPADARNGSISVDGPNNTSTSVAMFKPLMKITGFDQANYQVGNMVTVNGTNFLANGVPTAKLGVNAIVVGSPMDTSFQFVLADNALTAGVSMANGNGTTTSPTTVKVRPTITGDPAPNEAVVGTHIIISGKTFTGTTAVKFNDAVTAPFVIGAGGTTLNVTVPTAAQTGKISITNAGGKTLTLNDFLVDPHINSFTPTSGVVGTLITLSGTGFFGADRVDFAGGVSGAPTTATATSLKVLVPPAAIDGPLVVHTVAGLFSPPSAAAFNVLP
jgi:IPT/TIG domain